MQDWPSSYLQRPRVLRFVIFQVARSLCEHCCLVIIEVALSLRTTQIRGLRLRKPSQLREILKHFHPKDEERKQMPHAASTIHRISDMELCRLPGRDVGISGFVHNKINGRDCRNCLLQG